jgi:cytoskeleton protein RodZ
MFKQKQRIRSLESGFAAMDAGDAPGSEGARDSSAGGLLRRTREDLGWDIRDVAGALRIRVDYLEALERNTVDGLPGPTYATGFLRAYAEYLGLDGHEIVRRFRAEKTGLHAKAELAFPVPLTDRGIPGGGIFLIAVLIFGLGYGTYYYVTSGSNSAPATVEPVPAHLLPPPPSAPPPVAITEPPKSAETTAALVPPPTAAAAPPVPSTAAATSPRTAVAPTPGQPPGSPATAAATPATLPAAPAEADAGKPTTRSYGDATPGRIVIRATGKAWVTVKEGEKPIVNTLFNKGDTFNAPDRKGLSVKTGSAGALEVTVDGKTLPPLGPVGQIRTLSLDPDKLLATQAPG